MNNNLLFIFLFIFLIILLNVHQKEEHFDDKLKDLTDNNTLRIIKEFNRDSYEEIKNNISLFYNLVEYISLNIKLFTLYFNDLLIIQNYINLLIQSVHLNINQEPTTKEVLKETKKKVMDILDGEIYKLLITYKKYIKNQEINIFTQSLTEPAVRPYNML